MKKEGNNLKEKKGKMSEKDRKDDGKEKMSEKERKGKMSEMERKDIGKRKERC